jgi:hypothetical protein
MPKPTEEYATYQQAFDYFNDELFDGRLPPCLITLQRSRNVRGYFSPYRFAVRTNVSHRTDEIALNPDTFAGCSDKDIFSTLVHEQVHLFQAHFGKPGRSGYHNREWAREMLWRGLTPISLDKPFTPGKMTGQHLTHEIVPGGPFDVAADWLLATGFRLRWQSALPAYEVALPEFVAQKRNKIKYHCPRCGLNVWAKPGVHVICGECASQEVRRQWGLELMDMVL